jgi:hypothetical protein
MRSLIALFLLACLSLGVASAQSLSGPVEGFLFDQPTQSLRAVDGFPGSAMFGPALESEVTFGSVAPYKNYAIAFKSGHCLFLSALGSGHLSTVTLTGVVGEPDGVVWSADSSVAVLYSSSGNWIQTVSGLPKTPHVNSHLTLSALGGTLADVATDADGKKIAIAMRGSKGGVFLNTASQKFVPLLEMENPMALSFSEDGADLYALDGAALKLSAITLSNSSSRVFPLPGLKDPFAIRAGHDTSNRPVVFVASLKDRLVGVFNPSSENFETTIHLSFKPTGLQDLGRNSFVIGSRAKPGDPLWLFSTAPKAAVYFVPAAPASSKGDE